MTGSVRLKNARQIGSRENPIYRKLLQLAGVAHGRRRQEACLIEGIHLCQSFLATGARAVHAVVAQDALKNPQVVQLLEMHEVEVFVISEKLFRPLSAVEQGIGIAMVINTPTPKMPDRLLCDAVYLDRLQDPGNVGTILRVCAAAAVQTVITAPGTTRCWAPKVLRAGMGAHFHLSIHESVPWHDLTARIGGEVRATASSAPGSIWTSDLRPPALWLFGQEGAGLAAELLDQASCTLSIPQSQAVESLNVGVAAALCLYEQNRQRQANS